MPTKLALTTLSGQVKLSPTGANLGTFALNEGCAIGPINIKLVGEIRGLFSNSASQFDFNTSTSAEGLRLQSAAGPKATAVGSIGLKAGASSVNAEALAYAYAWNRCTGASCSSISGATGSTYTPVSADIGKTLTVTVTGTDSNGSTPATSAKTAAVVGSLSWYVCGESASGVYSESYCINKGGSNAYAWLRPSTAPFTATNVEGEKGKYTNISWIWGGIDFNIECTQGSGGGTLSNGEAQANIKEFKVSLSGCSLKAPATVCEIASTNGATADHKMVFHTLEASSPTESATEIKRELKFVPESGVPLVEVTFLGAGCPWSGNTYSFTGYFPTTFLNAHPGFIIASSSEVKSERRYEVPRQHRCWY